MPPLSRPLLCNPQRLHAVSPSPRPGQKEKKENRARSFSGRCLGPQPQGKLPREKISAFDYTPGEKTKERTHRTWTLPPLGVNLIALETRFQTTCSKRLGSAIDFACAATRIESTAVCAGHGSGAGRQSPSPGNYPWPGSPPPPGSGPRKLIAGPAYLPPSRIAQEHGHQGGQEKYRCEDCFIGASWCAALCARS
jgi:hypothetical protein